MKLGFDLDDVVVDLVAQVKNYICINYGINWSSEGFLWYDFEKCVYHHDEKINNEIVEELKEVVRFDSEFNLNAEPIENAREVLQKFKRNGHELYFITSRAKQLQPVTFKWLRKNDIPFDKLIVTGSRYEQKGVFGRRYALDMYVDDLEEHLKSMLAYKKKWRKGLILFDKPWNCAGHDGSKYIRIKGWKDLLRHVGIQNR